MFSNDDLQQFFQYAMALCSERADALDAVQSSLESFLNTKNKGQEVKSPNAYIRTSIKNKIKDRYKENQRWGLENYTEGETYDISPLNLEELVVQANELDLIWSQLEFIDRDILYHWAVLGFSTDEISEKLDIPRGTLLSRKHRLKKRFELQASSSNSQSENGSQVS